MKKETTIREITEAEFTAILNAKQFKQISRNKKFGVYSEVMTDGKPVVLGGCDTKDGKQRFFVCDGDECQCEKSGAMFDKVESLI